MNTAGVPESGAAGQDQDVPFVDLAAQQSEVAAEVLPEWQRLFSTAHFIGGPEVEAFERQYAEYIGVRHCIGVANGTDALELAYRAAGVGPGDEVIVPVNTFIATAEAVSRIGAVPVFVDVDPDHLLIDPDAASDAITARTRAIAAVHLFGQTAPVERLLPLAEGRGIAVVEDAAQSQGAVSAAGRAGSLGRLAATSFYPGKNLGGAGDGGAVLTDDAALAHDVRETASHGSSRKYVHERIGVNSRLDAVQAVVLSAKLRRLDAWNEGRRRAAARYSALLTDLDSIRLPRPRPGNEDAWHLYVVQVQERDRVLAALHDHGIGVSIHYPTPLHLTQAYGHLGHSRGDFPVAEAAAQRILSLPIYPHLGEEQQFRVAETLRLVLRRHAGTGLR